MGTDVRPDIKILTPFIYMMNMSSDLLQCFTSSTILRAEFIVTLNICFYFIPCRTTRPKHAKLHLNGTVQSNTELDKTNSPLYSSSGVVFGQRERNGNEMEKKRKCSINVFFFFFLNAFRVLFRNVF